MFLSLKHIQQISTNVFNTSDHYNIIKSPCNSQVKVNNLCWINVHWEKMSIYPFRWYGSSYNYWAPNTDNYEDNQNSQQGLQKPELFPRTLHLPIPLLVSISLLQNQGQEPVDRVSGLCVLWTPVVYTCERYRVSPRIFSTYSFFRGFYLNLVHNKYVSASDDKH